MGRLVRHPLFWVGAREMAGVSIGLTAWAFMTGVAMVNSGMSAVEALAMSLLVFAGSAQLATIPLIAGAAPIWVILATALCVNLRFVVFSLHLRKYVIDLPRVKRIVLGYFTGDLTYVLFVKRFPRPPVTERAKRAQRAYLWGGISINWVFWQGASIAGIFLGSAIPPDWGLAFAAALALLALTCALATDWLRALAAVLAGIVACLTYALPLRLNIVVAIAVAVAVCMALEPRKNKAVLPHSR
jgi:predicted branched-subunit amino acid permease